MPPIATGMSSRCVNASNLRAFANVFSGFWFPAEVVIPTKSILSAAMAINIAIASS